MSCCTPTIIPFSGSSLSVAYGAPMRAAHGIEPNVQVYIRDGVNYVLSDDMNQVVFTGISIEADFGGPQVGFLKIF